MATNELSGTAAGAGFGNKTDDADPDLTEHHNNTRYGLDDRGKAYSGGHSDYRSGTVHGPGSGNKLDAASGDGPDLTEQHSNTRYNLSSDGKPYQGGTGYASGTVGGAGVGNKTAQPKTDSTRGKIMEKIGSITGKENMVKQGTEKRQEAAANANPGDPM